MKHKRNKTVGVALGGGAARGGAHIGILEAFDAAGVKIDYISGTSIGACIAALYAFGVPFAEMKRIFSGIKWKHVSDFRFSKFGFFSNEEIGNIARDAIGDVLIEDADIPLGIVACDVATGKQITFTRGRLAEIIMASTSLPGLFKPVIYDDLMLVDGAIVENVPISALKTMGADLTVACDLSASREYDRPHNVLDVVINSFDIAIEMTTIMQVREADIHMPLNMTQFSRSEIADLESLIEAGRTQSVPYIEALKNRLAKPPPQKLWKRIVPNWFRS